jgi:signal transduction histidine kinase/DNA-binding response OmpR family regulator
VPEEPTNILVVDDLPEKILVYRTILGELNQNLITVNSGEDALREVLNRDFAVILLDVNMPGMNGLETAAMIRRRKRSAHTPIIFLTAFADEVRAAEGYAQGAVDYITTPVVPAILRAKVRVFADLYRMTQQVRRQAEERIALAEERSKREAAEEANRRLAFLTHAGAVLGGSLDQEVTTRETVRLALSNLADSAALVIFSPEGRQPRVVRGRVERGETVIDAAGGRESLAPEVLAAVDRAATAALPLAVPSHSLPVPLRVRGRVIAVLWLSRSGPAAPFQASDVAVLETFASRAAIAMENARLYHGLQEADRQKNEFLSMLAHELRNPLAPIRNASEVLNQTSVDPARVRWAHGVIDRQLTHLVRLVDDLLDVSRLTLGKIRLVVEPVELSSVLAQAVEATRPLIEKSRHQLEVMVPTEQIRIQGDPARLAQVFANLLNNAAKYTDPGGRISLRAALESPDSAEDYSQRPPMVEVRIRDTGIGIAPELLPRVFDLFTQASRSLDRSQGGLGIGLTLVRQLVEIHGGTVEARSEGLERGSEFVVRLPVAVNQPGEQGPASREVAPHRPSRPLRVVLVDDNVDGVESLAELIGLLGHEVRAAHDGPAGIALTRAFDPDLVLLDIGLPGMDGYEVARRLRHEFGSRPVLVAVSGYGRDEDRSQSRSAGCEQHLVKPVDFRTLEGLFASLHLPV